MQAAAALPSYLADYDRGDQSGQLAGIDSRDVSRPVIRLLQSVSTVVTEGNQPDARPGNFWLVGGDMDLGPTFDFVICANRKRYILQTPINDPRGILARADDGIHWVPSNAEFEVRLKNIKVPVKWKTAPTVAESGLADFGSSNPSDPDSPPAAVLIYEHLILIPGRLDLGPLFFSCSRSQVKKVRRELYPKIVQRNASGIPMQALQFTARVVEDRGEEGPFFNVSFAANGFVPQDVYEQARELAGQLDVLRPRDEGVEQEAGGGPVNEKMAAKM